MAVRTLWHEVIEARQAEAKTNGADSREDWLPADTSWANQFDDLVADVVESRGPSDLDPRAVRVDLMAHLAAHIEAMGGPT